MIKELLSSQLFSVVVGAILTLIVSAIMSRKNVTNSLDEEVSKKRIETYKKVFQLVSQLNHSMSFVTDVKVPKDCFIGYIRAGEKEYHKAYCFPSVFYSFQSFNDYKTTFSIVLNDNRLFLDQNITNKLSFLDSYLGEIWHLAKGKDDAYLHMIGFVLSNELAELIQDIEDGVIKFINSENRKKIKNNFSNTYHYEYEKKKDTELNGWFLTCDIHKYVDFPLCINCNECDDCPLNNILEIERQSE